MRMANTVMMLRGYEITYNLTALMWTALNTMTVVARGQ